MIGTVEAMRAGAHVHAALCMRQWRTAPLTEYIHSSELMMHRALNGSMASPFAAI